MAEVAATQMHLRGVFSFQHQMTDQNIQYHCIRFAITSTHVTEVTNFVAIVFDCFIGVINLFPSSTPKLRCMREFSLQQTIRVQRWRNPAFYVANLHLHFL